jgi:hypothetical protein
MVQSKLSNADTKGRRQYDKIFSRGVGSRLFTRVGTVPVLIRFLTLGPVTGKTPSRPSFSVSEKTPDSSKNAAFPNPRPWTGEGGGASPFLAPHFRPLMNAAISGSSPALPLHAKTIGKNKLKKLKKEKRKSDGFL